MRKIIAPVVIGVVSAWAVGAQATPSVPRVTCHSTHRQAVVAVKAAERSGSQAIRALARLGATCGSPTSAHKADAAPPALTDALLKEVGNDTAAHRQVAIAVLASMSAVEGPPVRVPAAHNVTESGADDANPFGPPPSHPPMSRDRGSAHLASCWGYLANPTRIYDGSIHIGTITKTLGGWCGDSIAIYSISNWGHEVPWINPNYPSLCWMKYAVGHGPDSPWVLDNGAYHTAWAHGYIISNIGTNSGQYGCTYPYGRNWWSIIRVSRTGYHDGYNDYGFHT